MKLANIILIMTATLTALIAGLFFAWSVSVTLGLARVADSEYISVMQSINRAIQNPVFFGAFFGAQIFLPVCIFLFYKQSTRFWLFVGATVIYTIGVMGVTIFGNIPLNNALDRFDLQSSSPPEISQQRKNFEGTWNSLNTIRTVSSTLSVILVIIACLEAKKDV